MQQLQSMWNALETRRRMVVIAATLAMFAAVLGLARLATAPGMSLLYAGLEEAAAGEVIQALEARSVPYEVRGDAIFVASRQRDETRLMLAASGLPTNSHAGYELLESLSGFGTTSQMFDAAYWRAKEGELARTIVANPYIRSARVHIAQGSASAFRREIVPTASVTVTTTGAALTAAQARALRFLVASAVAGMTPEDVSIIDGNGGLVYGPEGETSVATQGAERMQALRRNVERLLEAHVGHGRAVVELSIDTVTDREVIHERRLDPETRIAISSETEENTSSSTDSRAQGVTVASNLPDGDAAATDGRSEMRENQTRQRTNYEMSETRREIERQPGAIRRMTVAVLIDGVREPGPDGAMVWRPRADAELEALRELVASAVGFDAERGDVITLRSLPFEPVAALGTEAGAGFLSIGALDVMSLIKWLLLLVTVVVLALFVIRPILASARSQGARPQLSAPQETFPPQPSAPEALLQNYVQVEQGVEPSDPVERLRKLIDERGAESVHVLRHWMDERRESQ